MAPGHVTMSRVYFSDTHELDTSMSAGAFNRESLTRLLKDKATLERARIYNLPLANRSHPIRFILMCPDDVQVRTQTQTFAFDANLQSVWPTSSAP